MFSALLPKVLRTTFAAIRGAADIELGEQVRNVVITVPDYVKEDLHEPILQGAEKAGFFLNRDGMYLAGISLPLWRHGSYVSQRTY